MDDIHRAFGLLALDLTLSEIEELLDVQSGTTTGRLLATFRDKLAWARARDFLVGQSLIPADKFARLERTVREVATGERSFQPSHRRKCVLSDQQLRDLSRYRDRAVWEALKRDLVADYGPDFDFERVERPLQRIEAGFLPPGSFPRPGRETKTKRDDLRRRVEELIVHKLAITSDGDLVRADIDVNRLLWVRRIRASKNPSLVLDELSRLAYGQIRQPNKAALILRYVVPGRERPLTLSCLAEGIGLPNDLFCDCVKDIIIELDYVAWLQNRAGKRHR